MWTDTLARLRCLFLKLVIVLAINSAVDVTFFSSRHECLFSQYLPRLLLPFCLTWRLCWKSGAWASPATSAPPCTSSSLFWWWAPLCTFTLTSTTHSSLTFRYGHAWTHCTHCPNVLFLFNMTASSEISHTSKTKSISSFSFSIKSSDISLLLFTERL